MINITGIGCGPCHAAVPFLNTLKERFAKEGDFELLAIETRKGTSNALRYYVEENAINYPFLIGTDEIIKRYRTGGSTPVYLILDENRIVRKVITGYWKEKTDPAILNAITELL